MKNKVCVVGVGMVGSTYAYSLVTQGLVDELVLIDRDFEFANAQATDIVHGTNFLARQAKVYGGTFADCHDADVVCITSGRPQKEGETRLDLAQGNAEIVRDLTKQVVDSGFSGIFLIASNPVDVMTHVCQKTSGFDHKRVIGSGTVLDTARFRQNLSGYLGYNSTQIHANIIGEHGDSSLPVWSSARVANKFILDIINEDENLNREGLEKCFVNARDAAYNIINHKGSTYFGIGTSLSRITKAILYDEHVILPVGIYLNGEFGITDTYIPIPGVVNSNGVSEIIASNIMQSELELLQASANKIKEITDNLSL